VGFVHGGAPEKGTGIINAIAVFGEAAAACAALIIPVPFSGETR
jgi:hypothetical protein